MERRFEEDDSRRARLPPRRLRRDPRALAARAVAGDRRLLVLAGVGAVWSALALIMHLR